MSIRSVFDFKFPKDAQEEGLNLCQAVGHDMTSLDGYLDHEVIRDVKDPGHFMVSTHWRDKAASDAVLPVYQHDQKINRAIELIGGPPIGFVADVLPKESLTLPKTQTFA